MVWLPRGTLIAAYLELLGFAQHLPSRCAVAVLESLSRKHETHSVDDLAQLSPPAYVVSAVDGTSHR